MPLLASARARDKFPEVLGAVRDRYDSGLFGFVIVPEHIHLLISEPNAGNPSEVMAVLKQRVSRALRGKRRKQNDRQMPLLAELELGRHARFWQRRLYDFNVWSVKKKNEKMNYMHFNPVKRGLVERPRDWVWSGYNFYWDGEKRLCAPNPDWECKTWRCSRKPVPAAETATSTAPMGRK
jgi:putative transposase